MYATQRNSWLSRFQQVDMTRENGNNGGNYPTVFASTSRPATDRLERKVWARPADANSTGRSFHIESAVVPSGRVFLLIGPIDVGDRPAIPIRSLRGGLVLMS